MLTLILGQDWKANKSDIMRRISERVHLGQGNNILIVPELISYETERMLCECAGNTASRYAQVLSFTRLASRVADSVGHGAPACMDGGGRVVAMASAARQLHSKLKAYASVETKPEFLTGMLDAVDEFKRCCITPKDLSIAAEQSQGSLAQKLEELSLLLEAYDGICKLGKRDPRDQMDWVLEQLIDSDFAQNHTFFIDGFPDFTEQHMAIISHLIQYAPNVVVSMHCDCVRSEALAFEKPGKTAYDIVQEAKRHGTPYEIIHVAPQEYPTNPVWMTIFQGAMDSCKVPLRVHQMKSVHEECVAAADYILDLVENGARFRDIRLVCPDLAGYKSAVDLVFRRCNIPIYLSGKEDILTKSVVHTVLSALDAVISGFEQKSVLTYLKSALSPLSLSQCDAIENYAYIWGVSGKQWHQNWDKHPDGLSGTWTPQVEQSLYSMNEARVLAISPLKTMSDALHSAVSLRDLVKVIYDFLDRIQMAQRLEAMASQMRVKGAHRDGQIMNQLWEILLSALNQLEDVLGNTTWDLDTFTKLLKLLLSQYDVGTIPAVLDAVSMGDVSTMRCQSADHLIVLGALEGNLPKFGTSSGVLTDQERTALRKLGVPLSGGAMDGLQVEFSEIAATFCGAKRSILVTCPAGQPSFVFKRLSQMNGNNCQEPLFLGSARVDTLEAGALLLRNKDLASACKLGLTESYRNVENTQNRSLGTVPADGIKSLYGQTLHWSATQIDRLANCRLRYFFEYGLRVRERKVAKIDPAEFGSYVHAVLEDVVRNVMALGGFHLVDFETVVSLAEKATNNYVKEHFQNLDSKRISYLFKRNGRELHLVLREVWEELRQSEFAPVDVELQFGGDSDMHPITVTGKNMQAQLGGFVDRVDAWQNDGKTYFRVVDYKTGRKNFDYCDVLNGIGLQMLLYLFALEESGQMLLGENRRPAGVQYFPARAPIISISGEESDEEVAQERSSAWKRKGLLLNDEDVLMAMEAEEPFTRLSCKRGSDGSFIGDVADKEQLKQLKAYIYQTLQNMLDDLADGNITPNPYTRGTDNDACHYCPYQAVCAQMEIDGRRNFRTVKADRFWEDVAKEVNGNGI